MTKLPGWFHYPGDWKRDVGVHMMGFASRGIWWEMLNCMWDAPERGKLEGSKEQIAMLIGCGNPVEFDQALEEISVTKTGDVTLDNGLVTIINRRMFREEKSRRFARLRKKKQRERENVTDESR